MNILWDFRLFSYGYSNRGVGVYTKALASAYLKDYPAKIFVLGDKECVSEKFKSNQFTWIDYSPCGWKLDLIKIPSIIRKHKIDIFHYWIALGPLHQIGLGLYHNCTTVATIYDMGVENWDIPFLKSVKRSWYYKVQIRITSKINTIICISEATSADLVQKVPSFQDKIKVIYKPVVSTLPEKREKARDPYFITLGGSRHKNVARVVKAFDLFRKNNTDYQLIILGCIDRLDEDLEQVPPGVIFENSMVNYDYHLKNSSGLIFCSLYEGLGLPPIEGMSYGCPLLVSDIPSVHETCDNAAIFVDPMNLEHIAEGMHQLARNTTVWSSRSYDGALEYGLKTRNAAKELNNIYQSVR
ncbi:MAG TPA: glycosyltransferase family 1 protein [Chitinispirillaceae bacterium]|nr:glycosyltransferase family 1 protein [Chitinispirillaceae bacterium]